MIVADFNYCAQPDSGELVASLIKPPGGASGSDPAAA